MLSIFSALLPYVIFTIIAAVIVFVGSIITLILDVRRMRQEGKGASTLIWYQRPTLRTSLQGIGISLGLLFFIGFLWYTQEVHLPLWVSGVVMVIACLVGEGLFLIFNQSKAHRDRRNELFTLWYRQPRIMRHLGQIAVLLGLLVIIGENGYTQAYGISDNLWNTILDFFTILLFLLGAALYFYANALQKRSRNSY